MEDNDGFSDVERDLVLGLGLKVVDCPHCLWHCVSKVLDQDRKDGAVGAKGVFKNKKVAFVSFGLDTFFVVARTIVFTYK